MWSKENRCTPTEQSSLLHPMNKTIECNQTCKSVVLIICLSVSLLGISTLSKHVHENPDIASQLMSSDIRGGEDVSGQDFQWIASWRFDGIHCCTGSLINKNPPIVATAAHCVSCQQTKMDLKRTLTDAADHTAESHNILYWIQHPDYGSPTISSNDIALIILDGETDIDVIPMVAPKVATHNVYPKHTIMDIYGYGFIDEADTIISDQLQHGIIYLWNKNECFNYLDIHCDYGGRWDSNAMLCGWDEHTSTERGDSGGPAVMNGYLTGINSWSPPSQTCKQITGPNYKILDAFVDIGSVRHWIEDTMPTSNTYFVAIHICDDVNSTVDSLFATLYGSNGGNSANIELIINNTQLTFEFVDNFNVFVIKDIDNIGWSINSITFELQSTNSICIDMVVCARLDGAELATGSQQRLFINNTIKYPLQLEKKCGYPGAVVSGNITNSTSTIQEEFNYYTIIIHICDSQLTLVGGSFDNIYVRLHGVYGTSQWFQLINAAMNPNTLFIQDGIFIFSVNTEYDIGVSIDSIDLQNEGNDGLCIDMVVVGNAKYPQLFKGSREIFFIDTPCSVNPLTGIDCFQLKTVQLNCYDFN